jgi:meso-butanediol dehydrogenase/(S,S)-butanediol dehydrogenase/diacetyl reductase
MYAINLEDKVAVVTGAARGIGLAIAEHLAHAGATVVLTDMDESLALAEARRLAADGAHTTARRLDVTAPDDHRLVAEWVTRQFGSLDVWVNNAGISSMIPTVDLSPEEWDRQFAVNAKGVFLGSQAAVRAMISKARGGVIVNMASAAAYVAAPYLAHYSASKAAVLRFSQGLAAEVAAYGIRVVAVCPGYVQTSMQDREIAWEAELRGVSPTAVVEDYVRSTPLGRLETPTDVARVVLFLCSELASFITGTAINVTGGNLVT